MPTVPRSTLSRPDPYDAIPRSVQRRDDIVGNAKRLYGALQTAHNTGWSPTYADLAEHLSASVRSIVRWVHQLVDAGLISVRRRGQGRSNVFTVLALVTSAGDRPSQLALPEWRRADPSHSFKETRKKPEYRAPRIDPAIYTSGPLSQFIHR